ncbi:MAG: hypothetical protein IPM74_09630 [Crocinitomicaceae bacterium]|nr:hypothetical protein [Crocinitomicaceae bacterium]MBK8926152.1 hypothetical protein [Crocinitomicaceae bacterium]
MKKILGLIAAVIMTSAAFSQAPVTFTDANAGYDKTTASEFHFSFTSAFTVDQIDKAAVYYTSYFTIVATASADGGVNAVIKLVENSEMSRRVITRFFVSLEIQTISAAGTDHPLDDFMATYILL